MRALAGQPGLDASRGPAQRRTVTGRRRGGGRASSSLAPHRPLAPRVGTAEAALRRALQRLQSAGELGLDHRMPARLQGLHGGLRKAALLEHHRPVVVGGVGQVDRTLHVQAPVQRRDQGLGGVVDDAGAARRAQAHRQAAVAAVEDQRRAHARARALAGLHAVGHRPPARVARRQREVGQLAVEQETAGQAAAAVAHQAGAEHGFDRRRHRQRAALGVDHADVAGAVLGLLRLRRPGPRRAARLPGRRRAHAALADPRRALVEVVRIEQARPAARGRGHVVGVGDMGRTVGIGQARRFAVAVQPVGRRLPFPQRGGRQRAQPGRQPIEQAEDLHHRQLPRTRRRHAADAPVLQPVGAQRLALDGTVGRQVAATQPPRVAGMAAHATHDVGGHRALVQRHRPLLRDRPQHLRQRRVAQHVADGLRLAVGAVEVGRRLRVGLQGGVRGQQAVQPRADRKAALGQRDGGLEQARPGQPAVPAVCLLEHAHHAGHTDRATADRSLPQRHGLAVGAQEQAFVGLAWRRLAAVPGLHVPAVPVQQEGAAADAAGLRLDQGQHHLHRHRRIQRTATGHKDLPAGLGGQRVGGRHRHAPERPARLGLQAGRTLGLRRQRVGRRWRRRAAGQPGQRGRHRGRHRGRPGGPPGSGASAAGPSALRLRRAWVAGTGQHTQQLGVELAAVTVTLANLRYHQLR
jgi:hypothetical protein